MRGLYVVSGSCSDLFCLLSYLVPLCLQAEVNMSLLVTDILQSSHTETRNPKDQWKQIMPKLFKSGAPPPPPRA